MLGTFPKRFGAASFSSQLTLTLTIGILALALFSSLALSWSSSRHIHNNFVEQGLHITEGFAHQSILSLLYGSGDNAKDAAQATLTFPDATYVEIRDVRDKSILSVGDASVLSGTTPKVSTNILANPIMESETSNAWLFKAPVYAPVNNSAEESSDIEKAKPELLGHVRVVISKNTSKKMVRDIFITNGSIALLFAGGLLIVLRFLTRRLTSPLTKLSEAMSLAETAEETKPRADVHGPKEITVMAVAFNKMMGVLEERENELRAARDKALEHARAKGEFATTVSHEIRTPMNGVLGTLEILRGMSLSARQQEYVDLAHSSAQALLSLINNILDFSKMEANKLELENVPFDLREIIEQVMSLMGNEVSSKDITLGYLIDPDVPLALSGDPTRLRQLVMNLVGNAIKFTEKGEVAARISGVEKNGVLQLTVKISDTGIGISPEAHHRIFESFSQVDSSTTRKYGGSGLGLSICKQIVEAFNGKIGLDSVPGNGSTFWFTIPVQAQPTQVIDASQHRDMQSKRALLFTQSKIMQDFLDQSLSSWGVTCNRANTYDEALQLLAIERKEGKISSLVLMDKDAVDAKKFTEQFRSDERNNDIRLLAITSYAKGDDDSIAEQLDIDGYINKPLRYSSLLKTVHILLKPPRTAATLPARRTRDTSPERVARRILVAEDNRTNQIVAKGLLSQLGYSTKIVANGKEAVEESQKGAYDAILMDCNMPEMDGYQACAYIRELEDVTGKHIPIIAMTANPKQGEAEKCSAVGMDGHVAKPLTLELVEQALDQCWAKINASVVSKTNFPLPASDSYEPALDSQVSAQLKKALGGSWIVMITAFLEDTPLYLEQLHKAVTDVDFDTIRSIAHTITGSSSNIGATQLASISAKLEDAGRERKFEPTADLLQATTQAYLKVVSALKNESESPSSSAEDFAEQGGPLIMVVDDDRSTRMGLRHALENAGFQVEVAGNGEEALNLVTGLQPEAILMDAIMPIMDGFAATRKLAQMPACMDIPVLIITKLDDSASIDLAFAAGASDYIAKPIHFPVLIQRIKRIVNARRAEKDVRRLAYNDSLTGLPNRVRFIEHVTQYIRDSEANGEQFALLFLDLDRFKVINDTLGHDVGDQLLKAVGLRIKHVVRANDQVSRLGGDEFTVILDNIAIANVAAVVAEKICNALAAPFVISGHEIFVKASIGIALYPNDGADPGTLLKHADTAMYRAKRNGNDYFYYEEGMDSSFSKRLLLENSLRRALERNEMTVFYQPKYSLQKSQIIGMEALVRWRHPTEGLVSPLDFIPLAEETGLIIPLGEWVMRTACTQIKKWCDAGFRELSVAVNISVRQIVKPDFIDMVTQVIEDTGIPAHLLELELTESVLMEHGKSTLLALQQLRKMGITLAIDDFGTGYSSFGYLKRLPVSVLKIDRTFVRDILTDPDDAAIVTAILALADNLRLDVVAEGVETIEQRDFLQKNGCEMFQGYYLSPPVPAEQFEQKFLVEAISKPAS